VDDLKTWDCYEDFKQFEVTNIDFHHDIWYRAEDKDALLNFDKYNCSNWLGYLYLKDKTNSIHWCRASNSGGFNDENFDSVFDSISNVSNIENLINEEYDIIYFVKSPQWVHYKFHHLYDFVLEMCKR
jgi:hypothetical protein